MELTDEEKSIIKVLIYNELEYYENKKILTKEDNKITSILQNIFEKLN